MQTWHCTNGQRHLPHTWYYRKDQHTYRCDGQDLRPLRALRTITEGATTVYCKINFKTKKALRQALQAGRTDLEIYAPGLGRPKKNGIETVEGPHYPEPHRWYARVEMKDGKIVRVVG